MKNYKSNKNTAMQRHQRNLKKSINASGNGGVRYEYIYTREQLIDSYLSRMDDLGYELKVEPKRDRYVMNKQVLEKTLIEASTRALQEMQEDIMRGIITDVYPMIEQGALTIADDVFSLGTAARPTRSASNEKSSWAYKLGAALGKAIANSFDDIVNGR